MTEHACAWCGADLGDRRETARYCPTGCRTKHWKWRQGLGPAPPAGDAENGARPAWRVRDAQRKRERREAGEVLPGDMRVSFFKAVQEVAYELMLHGVDPVESYRLAERGLTRALPDRLARGLPERAP